MCVSKLQTEPVTTGQGIPQLAPLCTACIRVCKCSLSRSADVAQQNAVVAQDESSARVRELDLVQVPRDAVGRAVALPRLAVVLALQQCATAAHRVPDLVRGEPARWYTG